MPEYVVLIRHRNKYDTLSLVRNADSRADAAEQAQGQLRVCDVKDVEMVLAINVDEMCVEKTVTL